MTNAGERVQETYGHLSQPTEAHQTALLRAATTLNSSQPDPQKERARGPFFANYSWMSRQLVTARGSLAHRSIAQRDGLFIGSNGGSGGHLLAATHVEQRQKASAASDNVKPIWTHRDGNLSGLI